MAGSNKAQNSASGAPAAAAEADARAKVLGWARRSIDLIPTSWLITGAAAVLLAATALFGGLEAAAVAPTPDVTVNETFAGSDLEMTVTGVELRDDRGELAIFPDEEKGERVLLVIVDVVNTFTAPRGATSLSNPSPVVDGIRIEGIKAKGEVFRADDALASPILQPGVPARLLLAWIVPRNAFAGGDEVALTLPDSTHRVGKSVMRGDYWDDVHVGATLSTTITEAPQP